MELTEGILVLADISGYTKFVTQTEIDHSFEILHELLDTMVRSVRGQLEVSQVEGDCILFIGGVDEAGAVRLLEASFVAYHRRLRAMQSATTCPCAACRNLGTLQIKFILHRGTYTRQKVGGVEQLHGSDVIVGFRLLKNSIPSKQYLFATEAVLARLPDRDRFTAHAESYDHIGEVRGGYVELEPLWQAAVAAERRRVEPADAKLKAVFDLDVPAEALWPIATDPALWMRMMELPLVERLAGARGTLNDGEFHCHHGKDMKELIVFRVLDTTPYRELHMVTPTPAGVDVYQSFYAEPLGPGRTRWSVYYDWKADRGIKGTIQDFMIGRYMQKAIGMFHKNLPGIARELAASTPAASPA